MYLLVITRRITFDRHKKNIKSYRVDSGGMGSIPIKRKWA